MEPLSISMSALVELLKEDGTVIPIDFARKTARQGVDRGDSLFARRDEPNLCR